MITDRPTTSRFSPRTLTSIGIANVVLGLAWSLFANQPQHAILATYPADWSMALYFAIEHLPTEAALFSAVVLLVRALRLSSTPLSFGFTRFPLWALLAIPLCMVVIYAGNAWWQLFIRVVLAIPLAPPDTAFADWWQHDPLTFLTLTLIYCVIAPPFEEMLFRGMLFQYLVLRRGVVIALLLSSIIFAVVHVDIIGFGGYFGLAVCSALLFRYGRSIWPCIVLHAAMNGLSVLQSMGLLLR